MAFRPEQGQPRGVEEQQTSVAPKTTHGEPETISGEQVGPVEGSQPVFDRLAALEQRLAKAEAEIARRDQEAQARREHRRESNAAAKRRWRERNPDRAREQNTRHVRAYRARKRGWGF